MRYAIFLTATIAVALLAGCDHSNPTEPTQAQGVTEPRALMSLGRWSTESSNGACLTVEDTQVTLIAGCWRGRFSRPSIGADGTFSAEGTFRFEAGPSRDDPAPPAHFTGAISGTSLTLNIQRTGQSGSSDAPVSFALTFSGEGTCSPLCV